MRMRKYRIVKRTLGNGEVTYHFQRGSEYFGGTTWDESYHKFDTQEAAESYVRSLEKKDEVVHEGRFCES